jgi:hypothetical protein
MELFRRFAARYPTGLAAYLALEVALMRRYVARGGTEEDFCRRLAPVFHRRYAALFLGAQHVAFPLPRIRAARHPQSAGSERGADSRVATAA